jgi:hypothetical protein
MYMYYLNIYLYANLILDRVNLMLKTSALARVPLAGAEALASLKKKAILTTLIT